MEILGSSLLSDLVAGKRDHLVLSNGAGKQFSIIGLPCPSMLKDEEFGYVRTTRFDSQYEPIELRLAEQRFEALYALETVARRTNPNVHGVRGSSLALYETAAAQLHEAFRRDEDPLANSLRSQFGLVVLCLERDKARRDLKENLVTFVHEIGHLIAQWLGVNEQLPQAVNGAPPDLPDEIAAWHFASLIAPSLAGLLEARQRYTRPFPHHVQIQIGEVQRQLDETTRSGAHNAHLPISLVG